MVCPFFRDLSVNHPKHVREGVAIRPAQMPPPPTLSAVNGLKGEPPSLRCVTGTITNATIANCIIRRHSSVSRVFYDNKRTTHKGMPTKAGPANIHLTGMTPAFIGGHSLLKIPLIYPFHISHN